MDSSPIAPAVSVTPPSSTEQLMEILQSTFSGLQEQCNKTESTLMEKFSATQKELDSIEQALSDMMDHSGVNDYSEVDSQDERENVL